MVVIILAYHLLFLFSIPVTAIRNHLNIERLC